MEMRISKLLSLDIYQKYINSSPVHYLEIYVEGKYKKTPIHITPSHSLLVRKKSHKIKDYIFASQLELGDYLYLATNNYQLINAYAPLTFEGNIIVNDFIVSCYRIFTHHIAHFIKNASTIIGFNFLCRNPTRCKIFITGYLMTFAIIQIVLNSTSKRLI